MSSKNLTESERDALRKTLAKALDELTDSLTQVLKAVDNVHEAVARLGGVLETGAKTVAKDEGPQEE